VSVTSPVISVDDEADGINKEDSSVNQDSGPNGDKPLSAMDSNSPPRLEVTPPRIQISPEASGDQERGKTGIGRPASSSLSPSRIPSRKNSNSIQTASGQSEAVNDDLKVLESRLERFVTRSSDGSEASESSDMSGQGGAASVTNRLFSSGTVSSRAKSGDSGGSSSPPEKGSMLRNTLRKMTMFSIGDKKKPEQADDKFTKPAPPSESKSRSRAPFLGKSRVPKSQSPGPSSINRSRSFKEPGNSVSNVPRPTSGPNSGLARNNVYTSSLRRTKIKNQKPEEQPDAKEPRAAPIGGRPGFERSSMRRSMSSSRSGASLMTSSMHTSVPGNTASKADKLVKKSRTVQTFLTKDPVTDRDYSENEGHVNFEVWLPDLLGDTGNDEVETHVTDYSEPLDVRKNRALTLENLKLSREVERLRGFQGDNDLMKKEVKTLKSKLEEEQKCRGKIQADLEQYQSRVKACMESMDCVERQFESRDLALAQMEGEQARMEDIGLQLRTRLGHAEKLIGGQKRELERSLAAQKTLLHQLQESEQEAREMQEFLQAEKGTLQEALREGEQEIRRLEGRVGGLEHKVVTMEEQSAAASRHYEAKSLELGSLRQELGQVKERAREMLLAQGAEMSRAIMAIMALTNKMETLTQGTQEAEADPDSSGSDPAANIDLPARLARRSSQFLITPTENIDRSEMMSEFSRALMATSTGSDTMRMMMTVSSGSDIMGGDGLMEASVGGGVPGLAEQIGHIEELVTRLVTRTEEAARSQQENIINGNTEEGELSLLREAVSDKERVMAEMMTKFSKNRQILTNNWEQAESEVRRLDDIYHDTVSRVLGCLASLPDLTQQHPSLVSLVTSLKVESAREAADITDTETGNSEADNLNGHVGKMTTSLLTSFPNSREVENMNVMSKSQGVIGSNTNIMNNGLSQSIKSDPGLIKSAGSPQNSNPTLSHHLSGEDVNANQSL